MDMFFVLQFSVPLEGQSFSPSQNRRHAQHGEDKGVVIKKEKAFKAELTPLFYTGVFYYHQQNPRSKTLNHTSVAKQAGYFWPKGSSFSGAIDNVNHETPGEVSPTHPEWANLMSSIPRLPCKGHVHKRKRGL